MALAPAAGLSTPVQQLDLNTAPVLRRRTSVVDPGASYSKEQFDALQKLDPALVVAQPTAPAEPPPAPMSALPPASPPSAPAAANPAPTVAPTAVLPPDTSRVQDRINQLYGRTKTAEERAAELETKLSDLQRRLDESYRSPPSAPSYYPQAQPAYTPYGYAPEPVAAPLPPAASDTVTKAELLRILQAQRQEMADNIAIANAHSVARLEAEREFPDVYANPELRATASEIWQRDPLLQRDPLGVKKAALMARGLSVQDVRAQAAASASQSVRKEALAGIGSSVPEGTAQAVDPAQRLSQALTHARNTGRIEDFVQADLIRRGLA